MNKTINTIPLSYDEWVKSGKYYDIADACDKLGIDLDYYTGDVEDLADTVGMYIYDGDYYIEKQRNNAYFMDIGIKDPDALYYSNCLEDLAPILYELYVEEY